MRSRELQHAREVHEGIQVQEAKVAPATEESTRSTNKAVTILRDS